jgi:hypothetical protein
MCVQFQRFALSRLQTNMADVVDMAFSTYELSITDFLICGSAYFG